MGRIGAALLGLSAILLVHTCLSCTCLTGTSAHGQLVLGRSERDGAAIVQGLFVRFEEASKGWPRRGPKSGRTPEEELDFLEGALRYLTPVAREAVLDYLCLKGPAPVVEAEEEQEAPGEEREDQEERQVGREEQVPGPVLPEGGQARPR